MWIGGGTERDGRCECGWLVTVRADEVPSRRTRRHPYGWGWIRTDALRSVQESRSEGAGNTAAEVGPLRGIRVDFGALKEREPLDATTVHRGYAKRAALDDHLVADFGNPTQDPEHVPTNGFVQLFGKG